MHEIEKTSDAAELSEGMGPSEMHQPEQISRGVQTAWIVSAIVLVGLVIAYNQTRLPDSDPYSQCQVLFWEDQSCAARVASERVMGGDGWGQKRDELFPDEGRWEGIPIEQNAPAIDVDPVPVDPQIRDGMRRAIELNEMICKQTGQNCEIARSKRREWEEQYGSM